MILCITVIQRQKTQAQRCPTVSRSYSENHFRSIADIKYCRTAQILRPGIENVEFQFLVLP